MARPLSFASDARLTATAWATASTIANTHPERFDMVLEQVLERLPQKVRV
jgi:hypothetical protein